MARKRRRDVIDESTVGAYHVWTRTARRAFLLGEDQATRRDFNHRKELIRRRIEDLCSVYAVECCDHTVLDNHLHLILRNRPDIVATWSDEEVARRWLRLRASELDLHEPKPEWVAELLRDPARVAAARKALSSISSFMKYLKQPLAVLFNIEDDATGCFWQSRFSCERLKNDAALLVCSLYVNLNPIAAGMADSPEEAEFTSTHARIQDAKSGDRRRPRSGYLTSVHVDGDGYDGVAAGRRASNKGYLGLSFAEHLELLDLVARREALERSGGESRAYPPVLERLGIDRTSWEHAVRLTSRRFARELAILRSMRDEARPRS